MNKSVQIAILLLMALYCLQSTAQQILVDEMVEAASLNCFPVLGDENTFYYLPAEGRLGKNQNGLPEFSYLRYVMSKSGTSSDKAIVEADGGAVLHFLAEYTTTEEQVKEAENELKAKLDRDVTLAGPVVFKDARYTIVSSILQNGKSGKRIITTGEAPIFQNSKLAFSFELDPKDSKVLLESFKMATPDISLIFEFSFDGLSHNFEGNVTVNWEEFNSSHTFGAGGSIYFVGADVEAGFETLRKQNTIDVNIIGGNEYLEQLLNTVYEKLLKLVFDPVKPETLPDSERGGLEDAISGLLGSNGAAGSSNTTGFGLNVSYKMKQFNFTGKSTINLKGRQVTQRKHFVTFNIGDLYKKHGRNEKIFKDVSLYDITFLQRDVFVGIDGSLADEFNRLINSVTVTLRKKHQDGSNTLKEISINKQTLTPESRFVMSYLNHKDLDLLDWRSYEYQTHWQFVGGGEYISDWKTSTAAMINLYVPYKRKQIEVLGSLSNSECNSIRAVSVELSYPFFGKTKTSTQTFKTDGLENTKSFEITLPESELSVDCKFTAFKQSGTIDKEQKTISSGIIFIDDICR